MNTSTESLNLWKAAIFKNNINEFIRSFIRSTPASVPGHHAPREHSPVPQLSFFTISRPLKKESGDFFLMAEKNGESVICLGDAMGHGSAAARLAEEMLRILSTVLKKLPLASPSSLLKYSNFLFNLASGTGLFFNKTADLAICRIDHYHLRFTYASAKISMILVRKGQALQLENDRVVIGHQGDLKFDVRDRMVQLEKGDLLFLYTDGITDQFGGDRNKKLGSRKLLEFLETIEQEELCEVERKTTSFLKSWGQGHEQTDDTTLIGILI